MHHYRSLFLYRCTCSKRSAQGSVLCPILFILIINDLESICCGESNFMLFADDAKLYSRVDINQPITSLQQSYNHLCSWAEN